MILAALFFAVIPFAAFAKPHGGNAWSTGVWKPHVPDITISAGGGLTGGATFKNALLKDQYKQYTGRSENNGMLNVPTPDTTNATQQGLFDTKETDGGFGFFAFVDATFLEVDLGFGFHPVTQTVAIPNLPNVSSGFSGSQTYHYWFNDFQISVKAKYPFELTQRWTLTPFFGFGYRVALGSREDTLYNSFQKVVQYGYGMPDLGDYWNRWKIDIGLSVDYNITSRLYVRGAFAWDIDVPNDFENGRSKYWQSNFDGLQQGIRIDLTVGYKLTKKPLWSNKKYQKSW
jgi:hypothetical protein